MLRSATTVLWPTNCSESAPEESLPVRLVRRLSRDVRQRHRSPRYVIRQMLREMLPGERRFIRPLREHADLVVRDPQHGITAVGRLIGDS